MSEITCFPTSSPIPRPDHVHAIFRGVPRPTPRGVLDSSPYAYLEAVSLVRAVVASKTARRQRARRLRVVEGGQVDDARPALPAKVDDQPEARPFDLDDIYPFEEWS